MRGERVGKKTIIIININLETGVIQEDLRVMGLRKEDTQNRAGGNL